MQVVGDRLTLSPSDLNDHVECAHLTTLALAVARGVRKHPYVPAAYGDLLRGKGEEHELAYLAQIRAQGRDVHDARPADPWDFPTAAGITNELMTKGVD